MTVTYLDGTEAGVSTFHVNERKILILTLQAPKPNTSTEFVNIDLRMPFSVAVELMSLMTKVMYGADYVDSYGDCEAWLSENMSEEAAEAFYNLEAE